MVSKIFFEVGGGEGREAMRKPSMVAAIPQRLAPREVRVAIKAPGMFAIRAPAAPAMVKATGVVRVILGKKGENIKRSQNLFG